MEQHPHKSCAVFNNKKLPLQQLPLVIQLHHNLAEMLDDVDVHNLQTEVHCLWKIKRSLGK
tara:strand:- start:817 stop:999 length:183 start_codon:yes stop_codon:yes gene_type:complete